MKAQFENSIMVALKSCGREGFKELLKLIRITEVKRNQNKIVELIAIKHMIFKDDPELDLLVKEVTDDLMGQKYDQQLPK